MGSTAPGSSLLITEETELFARLCHLLINGATQMFRMVLDLYHPPPSLPGVLQREKRKLQSLPRGVMNPSIWNKLYPTPTSYGTSADLDISALFVLSRNICGLQPPASTKSWDKAPPNTDVSLEADLVRLKRYRNSLYGHITETSITEDEFSKLWDEISDILIRRGGAQWKTYIDHLLASPFTIQGQSYVSQLTDWYSLDSDMKIEIQKVEKRVNSYHFDVKANFERLENEKTEIEIMLRTNENSRVLDVNATFQKLEDIARQVSNLRGSWEKASFQECENVFGRISDLNANLDSHASDAQREFRKQEEARKEIINQLSGLTEAVKKIKENLCEPEKPRETIGTSEPFCKRPKTGKIS